MRPKGPDRPQVCLGFDGSTSSDWTGIRAETWSGRQFTPTYGPDKRPTYWDPSEWGGTIPRHQVKVAMTELFATFDVERAYFDPRDWWTEIDEWTLEFGDEHVIVWDTGGGSARLKAVHYMLERFITDLGTGALTHDGCKQTGIHIANARKVARSGERYILGKPNDHQKIDLAMCSCLAHEAACDARVNGWRPKPARRPMIVRR